MNNSDLIQGVLGNTSRQTSESPKLADKKDKKEWLIRTEDFQLWGPFSYNELMTLSKTKKLTSYDFIAKACGAFEAITEVKELATILNELPDAIFDETTDKYLDREVSEEATVRASTKQTTRFIRHLFNFSMIPLNTFLWVILFGVVTAYCLYYVYASQ